MFFFFKIFYLNFNKSNKFILIPEEKVNKMWQKEVKKFEKEDKKSFFFASHMRNKIFSVVYFNF